MGQITVTRDLGGIPGLCRIQPHVYEDARGSFVELYHAADFKAAGFDLCFLQDSRSVSARGVLRGLHFQRRRPQTKLCWVSRGCVYDVAVDLRADSPSFGRWHGTILDGKSMTQLLIPRGFAHGFLALEDGTAFCYKCDVDYDPTDEGGIAWDDPALGIDWPVPDGMNLILSERDRNWPTLAAYLRAERESGK